MLSTNEEITQASHNNVGIDKSFYRLLISAYYFTDDVRILPVSFLLSGFYFNYSSSYGNRNISGHFLSSFAKSGLAGYLMNLSVGYFNPQNDYFYNNFGQYTSSKNSGLSVRCGAGLLAGFFTKDSICPKGWMLSTNGKVTDMFDERYRRDVSYMNLIQNHYNINVSSGNINCGPFSFSLSGGYHYQNATIDGRSDNGNIWTSSAGSANAYNFMFNQKVKRFSDSGPKSFGLHVRCGARFWQKIPYVPKGGC